MQELGMTFRVSDTNLQTKRFRKLARPVAAVVPVGTVIVAATVNLIVSLS